MCPHYGFVLKHVCFTCTSPEDARVFTITHRRERGQPKVNTVLVGTDDSWDYEYTNWRHNVCVNINPWRAYTCTRIDPPPTSSPPPESDDIDLDYECHLAGVNCYSFHKTKTEGDGHLLDTICE